MGNVIMRGNAARRPSRLLEFAERALFIIGVGLTFGAVAKVVYVVAKWALRLLACSDAEPNKVAVKVLAKEFAEVAAEGRVDERRRIAGCINGVVRDASGGISR
jgi:hypothetical protein